MRQAIGLNIRVLEAHYIKFIALVKSDWPKTFLPFVKVGLPQRDRIFFQTYGIMRGLSYLFSGYACVSFQ